MGLHADGGPEGEHDRSRRFADAPVTYNPTTNKVILNPDVSLARNTRLSAKVTTGATDLAGNELDQNSTAAGNQAKSWKFTTVK